MDWYVDRMVFHSKPSGMSSSSSLAGTAAPSSAMAKRSRSRTAISTSFPFFFFRYLWNLYRPSTVVKSASQFSLVRVKPRADWSSSSANLVDGVTMEGKQVEGPGPESTAHPEQGRGAAWWHRRNPKAVAVPRAQCREGACGPPQHTWQPEMHSITAAHATATTWRPKCTSESLMQRGGVGCGDGACEFKSTAEKRGDKEREGRT